MRGREGDGEEGGGGRGGGREGEGGGVCVPARAIYRLA